MCISKQGEEQSSISIMGVCRAEEGIAMERLTHPRNNILEEVCSDICDNYCKYRDTVDEDGYCEAARTGLECSLDRLN